MSTKSTTKEMFVNKAINVHGDRYDYSLIVYDNCHKPIEIICKKHGLYKQSPTKHLSGHGCKLCKKDIKKELFVKKANIIHENKYDYTKFVFKDNKTKSIILCKKHGEFLKDSKHHLRGNGCPECFKEKILTQEKFISKALEKHKVIYGYERVKFKSINEKIEIICKIHGVFKQTPGNHLAGKGCSKCVGKNKTTEEFIIQSNYVHENKYNYSKTFYIKTHSKVEIICKKHGSFWQTPAMHLSGQGCAKCKESKWEKYISNFLIDKNIKHIQQKKFKECKNTLSLPFDFYIEKLNLCIEYDGIHHFEPTAFTRETNSEKKLKNFEETKKRDLIKTEFCTSNNIELIRISYKLERKNIIEILNEVCNRYYNSQ